MNKSGFRPMSGRRTLLLVQVFVLGLFLPAVLGAQTEVLAMTVLPFKTTAEAAFSFLGESFSETLTTKLVGLRGVKVYERSQFARISGELSLEKNASGFFDETTVARMGKIVSVDYVLMGSAALADGTVSCNVRLVHVNSGKVVLSKEFRGRYPQELFAVQDSAALAVARSLEIKLSDLDLRKISKKPTEDMNAFGLYNAGLASGDISARIALLEQAVTRDPYFTQALSLLADLYEEAKMEQKALSAYARLLAFDPEDRRAAYNLALLKLDSGDHNAAETLLDRCLEKAGEDSDILYHLGLVHEYGTGGIRFGAGSDLETARLWYRRAAAADPLHRESRYALGVVCAALAQAREDPKTQLADIIEASDCLSAYLVLYPEAPNAEEVALNIGMFKDAAAELEAYLKKN